MEDTNEKRRRDGERERWKKKSEMAGEKKEVRERERKKEKKKTKRKRGGDNKMKNGRHKLKKRMWHDSYAVCGALPFLTMKYVRSVPYI